MEDTNGKTVNETVTADESASSSEVVKIDFGNLKKDLGSFVRGTVEEAINGLLDAEAEQICNAKRYERSDERSAHRNGHYERKLHTGAGEVKLKVPKLRGARAFFVYPVAFPVDTTLCGSVLVTRFSASNQTKNALASRPRS